MCAVTPNDWIVPSAPYEIIGTDHTSYTIVYTCDNYLGPILKIESAWILTRQAYAVGSLAWNTMF